MIRIIDETANLSAAREDLLDAAFGTARFAKTSERLREDCLPAEGLAFAAMEGDRLVGTVRLWNVTAGPGCAALLLGPLAVSPDQQGKGLGSALMLHAIAAARALGHQAILLVGDEAYYSRFGFEQAHTEWLWLPGPFERERFLGLELAEGSLDQARGMVSATGRRAPAPSLAELISKLPEKELALAA